MGHVAHFHWETMTKKLRKVLPAMAKKLRKVLPANIHENTVVNSLWTHEMQLWACGISPSHFHHNNSYCTNMFLKNATSKIMTLRIFYLHFLHYQYNGWFWYHLSMRRPWYESECVTRLAVRMKYLARHLEKYSSLFTKTFQQRQSKHPLKIYYFIYVPVHNPIAVGVINLRLPYKRDYTMVMKCTSVSSVSLTLISRRDNFNEVSKDWDALWK